MECYLHTFCREILIYALFSPKILIYALFCRPESFCAQKSAPRKVFEFSASGRSLPKRIQTPRSVSAVRELAVLGSMRFSLCKRRSRSDINIYKLKRLSMLVAAHITKSIRKHLFSMKYFIK